jgi:hypothetical protein
MMDLMQQVKWDYFVTAEGLLIVCVALVLENIPLCLFGVTIVLIGQTQVIIHHLVKVAKK